LIENLGDKVFKFFFAKVLIIWISLNCNYVLLIDPSNMNNSITFKHHNALDLPKANQDFKTSILKKLDR